MKKYFLGLSLALVATMVVAASARVTPTDVLQLNVVGSHVNLTADPTTATYTVKMPLAQGAANQCLTNDGAGNLFWLDPLNQNLTLVPVSSSGTITRFSVQEQLNPTADITGTANQQIQFETDIGADDSGFSVESAAGLRVVVNSHNKSSWTGFLHGLSVASEVGNASDAITGNSLTGFDLSHFVRDQATVTDLYGITYAATGEAGSEISNYHGFRLNAQIDSGSSYEGISLGDTLGTMSGNINVISANTGITTSAGEFHGLSLGGNIAALTGQFDGPHLTYNVTTSSGVTSFSDTGTYTTITGGGYFGLNLTPNIGTTAGGSYGIRHFPNIGVATGTVTAFEDGAQITGSGSFYQSLNLHPNLTGLANDFWGINVQPNVISSGNAYGLNIDMSNVTAAQKAAIQTNNADVSVNNGAMHVNAPNQAFVNVGNPTPVHNFNTPYVAVANQVTANADSFGFGPIANVTLGHDAHITSGGLGVGTASLGMIGLLVLDDSSSIGDVGGSFIAQVLVGGTGAGGVVGNAYGYRYVGGNFGSPSSITNARAFLADDPLGAPATNSWGFYSKSSFENYFGKSVKVGGAANGTNDKVSNASVGLEIEGKAFYPLPMSTTARNALTALQGMLINNVTTGNLERYDGAAWATIPVGSFVPTTRTISTTAPLTGGGDLSANRTIAIPAATTSVDGYLTAVDWTTFNGKQSALTFGNLTDAGTDGITVGSGTGAVIGSGTTLSQHVADTSHNGYLSATDWNTFNGKGTGTVTSVALSVPAFLSVAGSPVTSSGTLAVTFSGTALPLANGGTGATSAAGALANISALTTKGDLLGFSTINARVPVGSDGKVLTADSAAALGVSWQTPTDTGITELTGDVVAGPGSGSQAATIAALAVTNGKIANATIDLTAKVTGTLPVVRGGTNSATALSNNRVMQSSGGAIVEAAAITAARALISDANGIPTQSTVTSTTLAFLDATSSVQTQINSKQATISPQTFGATPNANGFSVSGANVTLQPADATNGGGVSTTTQSFAGVKTFGSGVVFGGGVGTQTTLNDYQEGTVTLTFTTGVTPNTNVTCAYTRIGKQVTLHVTSTTTFTVSGTPFVLQTATGALPAEIRPASIVQGFIYATGSALTPSVPAAFALETNGRVDLYKNGNEDNMVATTSYGLQPGNTITYTML